MLVPTDARRRPVGVPLVQSSTRCTVGLISTQHSSHRISHKIVGVLSKIVKKKSYFPPGAPWGPRALPLAPGGSRNQCQRRDLRSIRSRRNSHVSCLDTSSHADALAAPACSASGRPDHHSLQYSSTIRARRELKLDATAKTQVVRSRRQIALRGRAWAPSTAGLDAQHA